MKHVISLSYSSYGDNGDKKVSFLGNDIRVTQFNLNFDYNLALEIIKEYDGIVDAFALSGVPPAIYFKGGGFIHPQVSALKSMAKESPVMDGTMLKKAYLPWGLKKFHLKTKKSFSSKKVSVYSGAFHYHLLEELEGFGSRLCLGDPYFFLGLPFTLSQKKKLDGFIKTMGPLFKQMRIKKSNLSSFEKQKLGPEKIKEFYRSDVFVGNESTFSLLNINHLKGKTILLDFLSEELEEKMHAAGVNNVIVAMPNVLGLDKTNFSLVEACLQACQPKGSLIDDDAIIDWIEREKLEFTEKKLIDVSEEKDSKFAFIIHPLGTKHLFNHPLLKYIKPYSAPLEPIAEEVLSMLPGFFYGKIKGIVSEKNGKEVEGLIYTVPDTPKKLLEKDVNTIYKKLINLSDLAFGHGAGIIGLGAYTKIVGDAGVTVASQSPIPVTTGNSLSACATLWAAKFALDKMNFVPKVNNRYDGQVMVVGATGSIGAVSAKILAQNWKEIVLVAPRAYKILELKEEIKKIDSEVIVHVATKPDKYLGTSDLIITTTSAQGKKILDIEKVKSGAIICDVSRPFDIKEEDALKRPDVMVIASGEVKLPGEVDMKIDIGLEGNIVYACLAETALLAMEGKYENFTLSRNISYEKVLEIDRMAQEHGVRLSCIMGHNGFITDEEFALCRQHALKRRQGEVG